jgi:hypothetical protein
MGEFGEKRGRGGEGRELWVGVRGCLRARAFFPPSFSAPPSRTTKRTLFDPALACVGVPLPSLCRAEAADGADAAAFAGGVASAGMAAAAAAAAAAARVVAPFFRMLRAGAAAADRCGGE